MAGIVEKFPRGRSYNRIVKDIIRDIVQIVGIDGCEKFDFKHFAISE
jgi:hypothetical protein